MSQNPTASIDVLIPAFNAATTIIESVNSIRSQSFADIRIIVVDDGSTDATPALLADLAAADDRLVVLSQANSGIVDALNKALSHATAPFVARHDADDIAYPQRFQQQLEYLQAHPDCVAVGGNVRHIGGDGALLGTGSNFSGDVDPDPGALPSREPYLMHPFLLAKRSAMVDAGGYRHCFHSEDTDLYWRLLDFGRLHNLNDVLGEYRLHDESISSASPRNGRIAAKYSQLAAISHRRRREGRPDLDFERADLAVLNAAPDFRAVVEQRLDRLDPAERAYLKRATAAKLIELASYRPYRLTPNDCRQLRVELKDLSGVPDRERSQIRRYQAEVLRRYINARLWRQVLAFRFPVPVLARLPKRYWREWTNAMQARRRARK